MAGNGGRRKGWVSNGSRSSVQSCPSRGSSGTGERRARRSPGRAPVLCTNPPVILLTVCVARESVITVCASCRANSDFYDIALFIQIFIYLPYPPPHPPPALPDS